MSVPTFEKTLEHISPRAKEFFENYQKPNVAELRERVEIMKEAAIGTPPIESYKIDPDSKVEILNLRTDEAPGRSFKARGAWLAVKKAFLAGYRRITTASAGNHGQGVAYAVETMNMQHPDDQMSSDINMANNTPEVKKHGIRTLGKASVTLHDSFDSFEAARTEAKEDAENDPTAKFISPYDNYDVIAGQGTTVTEALLQHPDADEIHVTVGGGGALAGILETVVVLKEAGLLNTNLKIIVMLLKDTNNSFQNTRKNNWRPTRATNVDTFTEGSAVDFIGDIPAALMSLYPEHIEIDRVTKEDLARELTVIENRNFERARDGELVYPIPETTSLVTLAGTSNRALLYDLDPENTQKRKFITLTTGSNADQTKISELHTLADSTESFNARQTKLRTAIGRQSCVAGGQVGTR